MKLHVNKWANQKNISFYPPFKSQTAFARLSDLEISETIARITDED